MYIFLQIFHFGILWNDLTIDAVKLKKKVSYFEHDPLNEDEKFFLRIEGFASSILEKLDKLKTDFEEFLEKEDKNFPYVDLSVYFDGLRDLQSAVTALHNIHEERLE